MEKRSDGKVDCSDQSDEIDGNMIRTDESYFKGLPPPALKPPCSQSKMIYYVQYTYIK